MSVFRRLSFLLLFLALALSIPIAARAFIKIPTNFVPGDDAIGAAAGDQSAPAIARGGDTFLAVWADKRSNPLGGLFFEFETSSDIYGLRLDATGNPLETVSFPIATGPGSQENPRVVWNGTNWLVVYESYDIGGTGYYAQKTLEAVRVSPEGVVLDPKPIKLYSLTPSGGMWSVASDGNNWVLAFEGTSASTDLMAMRISPEGVVLDPPIYTLVPATYYTRPNLRLAYANGVFLLTWADFLDTMGIRFDSELNLLDAAPFLLLSSWNLADLTSNGSQYYAVWISQDPPNYLITVTGSRISTDGVMLDGNGVNISDTHEPLPYYITNVVWDGTNWRVTWEYQGVSVARVNPDGQVLDPGGVAVAGLTPGPTAPSPSGGVQLVWSYFNISLANSYDVFSASISADNVAGPIQTPSSSSPAQLRPDIAMSSAGYLLVFRSDVSGVNRIMAQPLDATGNPLTTEPILLDTGNSTNGPGFPTVAWNDSLYLVAWNNSSGIVAQRIQQDGTLVDPSPFVVMIGHGPTDVSALGDVFLVTGMLGINPEVVTPIAARVRGLDGVVLDNPALTLGSSFVYNPSVAVVGGRWLVVWEAHPTHDNPIADTMAAFVDADGNHPPEFYIYGPYTTGSYSYGTSIASSGSEVLVLQNAEISSGVEMDLAGRIVHSDGTLGLDFNLTPWSGNQYRPRVAWDGSRFIVVYQDQRNRLAEWELDQMDARSDLFGMRIASDGTILDPTGFLFSNSTEAEAYPNITAADGASLISASIMRDPPYSSYRIGYELLGLGGNAWPVAAASASPVSGDVPLPVTFSSAGSTDLDGSVVSYAWDFGDGNSSSEANPSHTYTSGGPFVATLTVTDDQGAETTNTVFVKALNPNQLPVANATADPMAGIPPFDVVFYATGSYDTDGWLGNFHWTFSDGGEYWGNIAYHTINTTDPVTATLTVFDNRNGTGTTTVVINSGNQPPILDPIGSKTVDELTTLVFTATASDPDVGQSLTFSLGAGTPTGASIDPLTGVFTWTPTEAQGPGIYPVKVIVTDDAVFPMSDFEIINVTVNEVNLDPIVDAGPDQEANEGQPVHFTGSFVDPGLLASPQADESILWDFGDGITTTGVLTPTHSFGNNGIFTVALTVTDTNGGAGHDSLQVSTTNVPPVLDALPDRSVGPGQHFTINGTFTDPGWLDIHTLTIEWVPGVTETLELAAGVYEYEFSHVYTALGDYPVTITATDPDGGLSSQVFTITVQLYQVFLPLTRR